VSNVLLWKMFLSYKSSSNVLGLAILLLFQYVTLGNKCEDITEYHQHGKMLPVTPTMVLHDISLHVCFRECEFYMFCGSVNFNRKINKCHLNCRRANRELSVVDDSDFVYGEMPSVVSVIYLLS
jgi:hypothetical protein